jgi:hypothetical protein
MRTANSVKLVFCAGLALVLATQADALHMVLRHGKVPIGAEFARERDWPAGTVPLANHPLRIEHWHSIWSGHPNDREQFGYHIQNTAEANSLVAALGSVETEAPVLVLNPDVDFRAMLFERGAYQATFHVGSQKMVDAWYQGRGGRPFGNQVLTSAPKIPPPTLTLYLGDGRVDLTQLKVPLKVRVQSGTGQPQRDKAELQATIERIEAYLKSRR